VIVRGDRIKELEMEMTMSSEAGAAASPAQVTMATKVADLNLRYVQALDDGRFWDWAGLFVDEGRYIVHPRDNREAGLEGYWIYCDSRKMIEDRVLSLKEVNLYNIHYDRHILSNMTVDAVDGDKYLARSNYMVVQTDVEGRSSIFSVGEYRDVIIVRDGIPKFLEKLVIPDTFTVNTLLATPI
jgi:3-phenylpropionate/cinnamic acid dioxygenase small subunit